MAAQPQEETIPKRRWLPPMLAAGILVAVPQLEPRSWVPSVSFVPSAVTLYTLTGPASARGLGLGSDSGEQVWLRLLDLQRAVDGPAAPQGRLRRSDRVLHATEVEGCPTCRVRIVRAVLVSGRGRLLAREPYVPLEDVVRAVEGSLDAARDLYSLHVGECRWCILTPVTHASNTAPRPGRQLPVPSTENRP
jgi:hypothetical protein